MSEVTGDYLRSQRGNASVLKTRLANIRSKKKCLLVFVLEGSDDLPIYEVWIGREIESSRWEPIVAKGKKKLLEFREMLARDKTGLEACTFFVVDHDYDGLRDAAGDERIFVLPGHSAENFLVTEEVIESLLRSDLGLDGLLDEREKMVEHFRNARNQFIEIVSPLCKILRASVGVNVGGVVINDGGSLGLDISIDRVTVNGGNALEGVVVVQGDIPSSSMNEAEIFFEGKELKFWIRGKFLLRFFGGWMAKIVEDRKSERPSFFSESVPSQRFPPAVLDIRVLAGRASAPPGFSAFLQACTRVCESECAERNAA